MTQLGKYEILEELGRGSFGVVYKVRDRSLDRLVALKVLHPQLTVDARFIENFKREARNLARVDHPNVVYIHEINELDGRMFIVMRYLSGGNLADLIAEGPIDQVRALSIIRDVAEGLAAGHNKGIIHRDIKPGNILFDAHGGAVVTDFGVARAVNVSSIGTASATGSSVGTPNYRPPELWRGGSQPSPATDVYSLACVLYEMLTGDVLFGGDTLEQVLTHHMLDGAEILLATSEEDIPEHVLASLKIALAKSPNDRYQDVMDFVAGMLEEEVFTRKSFEITKPPERVQLIKHQDAQRTTSGSTSSSENLLQTIEGHLDQVTSVAFSPDGRQIASCSSDKIVRLWDAQTGKQLHELTGHTHDVKSVAFSPDGTQLSSGGYDCTIRLWEVSRGMPFRVIECPRFSMVNSVAFSPDGTRIASGHDDRVVRIWNASTGRLFHELQGHTDWVNCVAYSPDGSILASGSHDRSIRLWDPYSGRLHRSQEDDLHWVFFLVFYPDGSKLAAGCGDKTIRIFDVHSMQLIHTLAKHDDWVSCLAISPDGRLLASANHDKHIGIWDARSGALLGTFEGHTDAVRSVAFSEDGTRLVSGSNSGSVNIWSVPTEYD